MKKIYIAFNSDSHQRTINYLSTYIKLLKNICSHYQCLKDMLVIKGSLQYLSFYMAAISVRI